MVHGDEDRHSVKEVRMNEKRYQLNSRIRYLLGMFRSRACDCLKRLEDGEKQVLFYRWNITESARLENAISKADFWTRERGLPGKDYAEMKRIVDILEEEENRQFPESDIITSSTVYHRLTADQGKSLSCLVRDLEQIQRDLFSGKIRSVEFMCEVVTEANALAPYLRDIRDLAERNGRKGITAKEHARALKYIDEGELDILDAQIRNAAEDIGA